MTNRLVSVGDDFNLPAAVNVLDANLPANLQPTALNATFVRFLDTDGNPISGSLVTIVVDTVLGDIDDIIVEEI